MRPPAHRWAVLTVGTACSTGCHVPLAQSSRPPGSACRRRAPCSESCRRLQLHWCNPPAGSVCRRHVPCSGACRRFRLTWCSPPSGSVCHRHAPCSVGNLHLQLPWSSPPTGTVTGGGHDKPHASQVNASRVERAKKHVAESAVCGGKFHTSPSWVQLCVRLPRPCTVEVAGLSTTARTR